MTLVITSLLLTQHTCAIAQEPSPEQFRVQMEAIKQRIEEDPNNAQNYVMQGMIQSHQKDYSSAHGSFTRALQLSARDDQAYSYRAIAGMQIGKYQDALSDCLNAIKINPSNELAFRNLPACYGLVGDYRNAVTTGLQVAAKFPESYSTWCNLSEAYYKSNRYPDAIEAANRAIKRDSNFGEAFYWRSLAYEKIGQKIVAAEDKKRALDRGYRPGTLSTYSK